MGNSISNSDDYIDSRDIIERIKELEDEKEIDKCEKEELEVLRKLQEDCDCSEWEDRVLLIRDSFFEDYARELAEDIGAIQNEMSWPCYCIDWDQAARELQMDYSLVEFDGIDYWYR